MYVVIIRKSENDEWIQTKGEYLMWTTGHKKAIEYGKKGYFALTVKKD